MVFRVVKAFEKADMNCCDVSGSRVSVDCRVDFNLYW